MTCSNIATHKEISFSSICANVALFASKDGNYTTATAKRTTKKLFLRRKSAGAKKKRQQKKDTTAKATKSSLGKRNRAVSNFFALIPTRSNYQMSAIVSGHGVGFQMTVR